MNAIVAGKQEKTEGSLGVFKSRKMDSSTRYRRLF